MPHRIDHSVLTSEIKFGVGMAPFGGITLAGNQNWFELLKAANVYSVRRKAQPGRSRPDRSKQFKRSRTVEGDRPSEAKIVEKVKEEKKTPKQSKMEKSTKPRSAPVKPRVPVINIIKASNESIPDLYISESSEEESDCEESCGNVVYEFPGMAASAEDMTVENPLFQERHFQSSYRTPELERKYWKDVFVESV